MGRAEKRPSIAVNYVCGLLLGRFDSDEKKRKAVLWVSVVFNLGLLFFFKYFNFVTGGLFPEAAEQGRGARIS